VGVSDHLPKLVVVRLLEPALKLPEPVQLICLEDKPERLLAELSVHGLDLVLNDAPVSPSAHVKAFNHLLGACPIAFFAIPPLAKLLRRGFPRSLDGNPLLLPVGGSVLRRELEMWLETEQVRPLIRGEFQDSALMKIFGQRGLGVFIGPAAIEKEICRQYGVSVIGKTEKLREQFYAISIERKVRHPAVVAITETARQLLCQ
jgi:LysR family transcriptional activator of nhaA